MQMHIRLKLKGRFPHRINVKDVIGVEVFEEIRAGNVRAATRLIRDIEDGIPGTTQIMKQLFPYTGNGHIIGLTGAPGAGKSTLTNGLIAALRRRDKKIGVLAVDPSSPFSGGALLGDRIRMRRHALDPDVFIRSLATRGALGGLSRAIGDSLTVMDSMGKDYILIETVGIGQQEVDIMDHAHTVLVVLVPGMGDAVQTIKAGVMEIADIFVINKADRDGADAMCTEINNMLDMALGCDAAGWRPPVVKVGNVNNEAEFMRGIEETVFAVVEHRKYLKLSGLMETKKLRKAENEFNAALKACILEPIYEKLVSEGTLRHVIQEVADKTSDPYSAAEFIAQKHLILD